MGFKILAINPGSTSTKVALFENKRTLLELTLRHTVAEIAQFPDIPSQLEWRCGIVLDALLQNEYNPCDLAAVIGRGGLLRPIPAGVYEVNDAMRHDLRHAEMQHASNLGGLIADHIAQLGGVRAYIADPVVVDEMDPVARICGRPEISRKSIFHALNQKAIARMHCDAHNMIYEESNLIVAHLGGGFSVGAHRKGRVVDVNNALDGDGPFAPERAGSLPSIEVVDMCFSGKYTKAEIKKMLAGNGGMLAHIGSTAVNKSIIRAREGDEYVELVLRAMAYNVAKEIGALATVFKGEVDAILLTGGVTYNQEMVDAISRRIDFIAPISTYPGENEMEALMINALVVLEGIITPKVY